MKTLFLLRHAKSSWTDDALTDHDRPLADRGREAAPVVAAYFQEQGLRADAVWVSSAVRTQQTYELMKPALNGATAEFDEALYGASSEQLITRLARRGGHVSSILVIGHNPCMEMTAWSLLREDQLNLADATDMARKFPTCALAEIQLPAETWRDIMPASGTLVRFIKPKAL